MKLFGIIGKKAKPVSKKPAKPQEELDGGIPSVNKKSGGSNLITIGGFGLAIVFAVVVLYMNSDGKKKEPGGQLQKKETAVVPQAVKNEMPDLDLKPDAPEPIEVSAPKGPKVPAPDANAGSGARPQGAGSAGSHAGQEAQPIGVVAGAAAGGNQAAPLSWFDRKRLSGSKQEQEPRVAGRTPTAPTQAAEDDATAAQGATRPPLAACAPGADCAPTGPAAKKSNLAARLDGPASVAMVKASVLPNRDFLITLGTSLDASLDFAIDSTQPGIVKATLSRDVSGANSHVVLMEKGTVLTGQSEGDLQQGQARIFIRWLRAETPNGVIVALNSPSADSLGRAGLDGYVDTKFKDRFGAAILISLIKDSTSALTQRQSGGGTFVFGNTASAGDKVVEKSLESSANIAPVLTKNQGEHINVIAAFDLDFSTVYKLKARKE